MPNKQYQYLQQDDVNLKDEQVPKDSILRTYNITDFEYRLQPEDILSIQFKSLTDEEYDFFSRGSGAGSGGGQNLALRGYLIDENGEIEFPVVGNIKVAGLTLFEAQKHIQGIASQYLDNPVIQIRLLNYRFVVLGEVGSQGVHTSFNNRISMLEALGMAGGLGELADRHNIKIIRQSGNSASVYYIDLIHEDFVNSPFYYVNQNDVIIVPPLTQRPFRQYFGQNLSIVVSSISFLLLVYSIFIRGNF